MRVRLPHWTWHGREVNWGAAARWAMFAAAWIALQPFLSLLHELTVLAVSYLLKSAACTPLLEWPIRALVNDPVYASVALDTFGNTHPHGLAMSGFMGVLLHWLWPGFFLEPGLVPGGAWISAVVAAGSSHLSQLLALTGADGLLILLGLILVSIGGRGKSLRAAIAGQARYHWLVWFGILLQVFGVLSIMGMQITQSDLEYAGLAQIATKLLASTRESYESNVLPLVPWLSAGMKALILAIVFGIGLLAARLAALLRLARKSRTLWWRRGHVGADVPVHPGWGGPALRCRVDSDGKEATTSARSFKLAYLVPVSTVTILVFVTLSTGLAATNFGYVDGMASSADGLRDGLTDRGPAGGAAGSEALNSVSVTSSQGSSSRPSVVKITGESYHYVYEVDGRKSMIRGVGYNVNYRDLSNTERGRRYEQDFAEMRNAGINTILGWDFDKGYEQEKFDELLLTEAQKFHLGVMMPYYLDPSGDYGDAEYQARIRVDVLAWISRFKAYPAVRMWAIGNEVFHGMPPAGDADAFAQFYIELAEAVHAADPNHPVIYRGAEDVYIAPLRTALAESGVKRPWFVFGMNIFTFRLKEVLEGWPEDGFDVPLVITEFGPTGLAPEDRPQGLVKMWRVIRQHHANVLGGIVYVWTTAGPEPVDRVFGLVDANGVPVDGSLEAIASEYRQDSEQSDPVPSAPAAVP